jgi:hypothetical protein
MVFGYHNSHWDAAKFIKTINWWVRGNGAGDKPKFQAAADAAFVCRKFETSRRREVLSFQHHREVASLPPAEADALLDWCEETRNRRIVDMWMACYTQGEIVEREDCSQVDVSRALPDFIQNGKLAEMNKADLALAEHAVDFDPPI